MYRQRKRDLNLKPNRSLDKRSNRGMIYENEELRMRTIAICDDVDKGQSDIKKLRKENDHLKREIWGLRDECEKLEVMLKRVCISANIPEIQLEPSSKSCDDDEEDDDDDDPDFIDDDDNEGDGGDHHKDKKKQTKHLEPSSSLDIRDRRESGTSVMTFDSDVGSYMESMFSGEGLVQMEQQVTNTDSDLTCFASDDPGSVILNPEVMSVEQPGKSEPIASTSASAHHHPTYTHAAPWGHQTALAPDLEVVREESESTMNSPVSPSPKVSMSITTPRIPLATGEQIDFDEETLLPDPNLITLPTHRQSSVDTIDPPEGRKTPVIQITPVGSPIEDLQQNPTSSQLLGKLMNDQNNDNDRENVQSFGCVAVVPKTFKVTSEIEVSEENNGTAAGTGSSSPPNIPPPMSPLRKAIKRRKEDASSNLAIADDEIIFGHGPRRSSHFPGAPPAAASTMPQMSSFSTHHHRSSGYLGYCCCNNEQLLLGGYNSEPSLNFEQPLQSSALCCRGPNAVTSPLTVRSVWNTVDKNIIIGFYKSFHEGATSLPSEAPKVQEIIDEVEKEFDPTLEKILGVRLIPGRIFISLRNASTVKSFLAHFKNGLLLMQQKTRIHFIEGATTKLTSRLVLSGIPQELSDLAVISALNQFGQVVAPLERRNYKGIDISERIAKMHLVIGETNVPDYIVISGYEVRIRVEQSHHESDDSSKEAEQQTINKKLSMTLAEAEADGGKGGPRRKYGFVLIPPTPPLNTSAAAGSGSILKSHKPIQRSSSSAPRLETQTQLGCSLPPAEQQKRTNSVCVGNISQDQHPSKVLDNHAKNATVTLQSQHHLQPKISVVSTTSQPPGSCSTPNLQPSPKKPLARLMVSSPGSFPAPPSPVTSPGSPEGQGPAGLKGFYKNFDPRRASTSVFDGRAQLSQQSSYSPRGTRRKTSVQFADQTKKNSLPWFGCCSWI